MKKDSQNTIFCQKFMKHISWVIKLYSSFKNKETISKNNFKYLNFFFKKNNKVFSLHVLIGTRVGWFIPFGLNVSLFYVTNHHMNHDVHPASWGWTRNSGMSYDTGVAQNCIIFYLNIPSSFMCYISLY